MTEDIIEISFSGKPVRVPRAMIGGRSVITTGKWCRMATIQGEEWLEDEPVKDPELFISALKKSVARPDIFAFSQLIYDIRPKHPYGMEWDSVAAIPITTFDDWWEKRVSRKLRQDITRGSRLGLTLKEAKYDDDLAGGFGRFTMKLRSGKAVTTGITARTLKPSNAKMAPIWIGASSSWLIAEMSSSVS